MTIATETDADSLSRQFQRLINTCMGFINNVTCFKVNFRSVHLLMKV